jgi:NAD(P)-dependent dehydrogenase (short-subunit alcohol dehydrogenase family)
MERMKGKVALITGATSGIGHEAAVLFAEHGIKVVIAGRNENAGEALVDEISKKGGEALFIQTDVTDTKSVQKLIEMTQKHFGGFDYALNNAGIEGVLAPLAQLREEEWDAVMNTNLKGLWLCMKYEILALMQRGGGAIVNVSSNLTRLSEPTTSVYTASKAGVEVLSRIAAVEYGKYKIRVNTINPGAVDTPMIRRIYSEDVLTQLRQTNPLGKIAEPHDVAQAALWLFSPLASHVNGTAFAIDGG